MYVSIPLSMYGRYVLNLVGTNTEGLGTAFWPP